MIKEKIDFALESFKNIHEIIKFIDQKASAILVIAGIVISALITNLDHIILLPSQNGSYIIFVTGIGSLVVILETIYILLCRVLKVRLAEDYQAEEYSLFYFEHLSILSRNEIIQKYEVLSEELILTYIIDQQHELAKILQKKVSGLAKAINRLFLSVVLLVVCLITFHLFLKNNSKTQIVEKAIIRESSH